MGDLLKQICADFKFYTESSRQNEQSFQVINETDFTTTETTTSGLNNTTAHAHDNTNVDALVYIVVVLLVYAMSMTFLMIKYIKRERREAMLDFYFNEYVKRDKFNKLKFIHDKRTAKRYFIMKFRQDSNSGAAGVTAAVVGTTGSKSVEAAENTV